MAVEVDEDLPEQVRRAFSAVPEVDVRTGATASVSVDGMRRRLMVLGRPRRDPDSDEAARDLARRVPDGFVGVVVGGSIPQRERVAIEKVGLSWCDGRGALHVAWPGVLVHIDRGTSRVRSEQPEVQSGLGPVGLRALQVLVRADDEEWTVTRLAEEAGVSVGQAHKVFRALEQNRLVKTFGSGPRQRRVIPDRRAALDWLATIDRARRKPEAAATYLYGRTIDDVIARFAERAENATVRHAVTGVAASHVLGIPLVSNVVVAQVRVAGLDAADALHRTGLEHLEAEDAGRGMNLELWTDLGELGTHGASVTNGVWVAPPVRVWLDIARQGGRQSDAAQLFREQVLERA